MDFELRQYDVEVQSDPSGRLALIDEIQIQQVLVNLIRNALDAMQEINREDRSLKITTSQATHDLLEVTVCDSGPGIPIEEEDKVFDAFFSTKSNGMGMGLAINRTIIESHGGRMWVTPNSDRGATFHFTVETAEAEVATVGVLELNK